MTTPETGTTPATPADTTPPQSAHKAVWGAVIAFVLAFAGALQIAVSSGANLADWTTWLNVLLVALVGGGGAGATVYSVPNKPLS